MSEQPFELIILREAVKQLSRLSKPIRETIVKHIDLLPSNPRPQTAKPLRGQASAWRLRVGDYRVVYEIDNGERRVVVSKVAHRRDVYRGL